jgi:hypothetical protein
MSGARAAGSPAGSARVQYVGHPSTDSDQLQTASVLCFPRFLFFFSFVTNGGGKGWMDYALP